MSGLQRNRLGDGLPARSGFAADGPAGLIFQHRSHSPPHDCVRIGDEDPDRRHRVCSPPVSRFTIGDRLFGTIIAFAPGQEASAYAFTSALPVQIFRNLLPVLQPLFEADAEASSLP